MPIPMFPLGSVVFPGQVLPLHVFEPRYRAMLAEVVAGDGEFGVVLIERGHEVGGGDVRSKIGTVMTIAQTAEIDDDRWAVIAVGLRRLRVADWLPDNPWPRAVVEDLPDPDPDAAVALDDLWSAAKERFSTLSALTAELEGEPPGELPEFSDEPAQGSFHLAALAPLGSFDRQRVLSTVGVPERLAVLADMLDDLVDTLRAAKRLS